RRGVLGLPRVDYTARDCLQETLDDYAIVGCEPLFDNELLGDLRPGLYASTLDHVLVVDYQEIFALLVEADRVARNQQGVTLLARRHAHPHEQTGEYAEIRVGKNTTHLQSAGGRGDAN